MLSKKHRGPDPAYDRLTAAEENLARAEAAETEALAELAALRPSLTVMDCDRDDSHVPPGLESASGVGRMADDKGNVFVGRCPFGHAYSRKHRILECCSRCDYETPHVFALPQHARG